MHRAAKSLGIREDAGADTLHAFTVLSQSWHQVRVVQLGGTDEVAPSNSRILGTSIFLDAF